MEKLLEEMRLANQKLREVLQTSEVIMEELGRIQPIGFESDNKNEDSNLEREN